MQDSFRRRQPFDGPPPIELSLERSPQGEARLHFSVRPSALVALALAILLHAVTLWLVMGPKQVPVEQPLGSNEPISVRMITPDAPRKPAASTPPPVAQARPVPPKPKRQAPKPAKQKRDQAPKPVQPPPVVRAPTPEPAPAARPPKPAVDEPTDMATFVARQRERRREAEAAAASENAAAIASQQGPSAEDVAAANIKRNLQQPGTNGVFQITRKGIRTAAFVFRGWTTDAGNARREFIEVDAGLNGDIERAVVRRMIELIRRYYDGDFNWESRRLGRTIVLSARPGDGAALEDFLIQEFFRVGANYPS
jgi:outer membrane biosynthesis protein TonB